MLSVRCARAFSTSLSSAARLRLRAVVQPHPLRIAIPPAGASAIVQALRLHAKAQPLALAEPSAPSAPEADERTGEGTQTDLTGETAVVPAEPPTPPPATLRDALRYLLTLIDVRLLVAGAALMLANVVLSISAPARIAVLMSSAMRGTITRAALGRFFALANLQALCKFGSAYCLLSVGRRVKQTLKQQVYAALLAQARCRRDLAEMRRPDAPPRRPRQTMTIVAALAGAELLR